MADQSASTPGAARGGASFQPPCSVRPLVSIVISNYNYGRFLGDAIESALAQTYPSVETLVVDDGSTDESLAVLDRYAGRVVGIAKANGGQGSAINAGFAASTGDIVIFLDADDLLLPEAAHRVVNEWRPGVAKVQYRLRIMNRRGEIEDLFSPASGEPMPSGDVRGDILRRFSCPAPATSGNAYHRSALTPLLPMPEAIWQRATDLYLNFLTPFYGSVRSLDETLGYYRLHGENGWANFKPSFEQRLVDDVRRTLYLEERLVGLARERGLSVAPHLGLQHDPPARRRVALRVIDPECYPRPAESARWLGSQSVVALWRHRQGRLLQRLKRTIWTLAVVAAPRVLAVPLARIGVVHQRRPGAAARAPVRAAAVARSLTRREGATP